MTESKLEDKLNRILVDIVSVTDDVRRQQLQDEYFEVETQLLEEKDSENRKRYMSRYRKCSLLEALDSTNGIDTFEICNRYKLRPLTTLENTRTLAPFLSCMEARLVIRDIEGNIVDMIGRGTIVYTVYVYSLSGKEVDMSTCVPL
jgi:hypothetical protein